MVISLSGGQTSAYMLYLLLKRGEKIDAVVFMNTGLEHPKTIKFLKDIQEKWGVKIICLESKVFHQERKASGYSVVSIDKLHMGTDIAKEVVKKYGSFGMGFPHCTRELKVNPFKAWKKDHFPESLTAIGIRVDEIDRMNEKAEKEKLTYPLIRMGVTKKEVDSFFENNSFKLEIPHYLGNCLGCWKKSHKKLKKAYLSERESFLRLRDIEQEGRKMFRGNNSVSDMIKEFEDNQIQMFDDLDHCGSESCEVF